MSAPYLLADISHYFNNDLNVGTTGDLATVTGNTRGEQRVIRRLMTVGDGPNGGFLFWNASTGGFEEYGAGLPKWIGRIINIPDVQALCVSQILLEDVVAKSPTPVVMVSQYTPGGSSFLVTAKYNYAPTSTPVVLSFTVS